MASNDSGPAADFLHGDLNFADDGRSRLFNLFRKRLRHWEDQKKPQKPGEKKGVDDKTGGGRTNQGMSQNLLDHLIDQEEKKKAEGRGPGWLLPRKTEELSDDNITGIYRRQFFDKLKIDEIADTPDIADQSVPLIEQLFDAGIHHGIGQPARWLQQAINEKIPPEKGEKPLPVDGNIGVNTIDALRRAARAGKIEEISDLIARKRLAFMKPLKNAPENPGWADRAKSFLAENYRFEPW